MIKLKLSLDPKDAKQMLALSRFAGTLADVAEIEVKTPFFVEDKKPEAKEVALAPSGRTVENQAHEDANGNTEPLETPEPPKRKRRSKAEIEADEAAAKKEKPTRETSGEEAESEEAEVEEEESDDEAPAIDFKKKLEDKKANRGSITLDDVRRAVAEKKGTAENFQKMKDRLKEAYGVETTPKLDPKYYAEFYDFVNSLK